MANCSTEDKIPSNINRRKKGKILQSIRKKMEFYFSDSNLMKDKYLYKLFGESTDGSLDLDIFLKFNEIRALTKDVKDIAEALSTSELLEVSPGGNRIHRLKLIERTNFDECTIYVEKLPPHANHKWLRDVFNRFGDISYTSIPKYKTGKIKGFAFVEFEVPEGAVNACKAYKADGEPDELGIEEEKHDDKDDIPYGKLKKSVYNAKDASLHKTTKKRKQSESDGTENISAGSKSVKCNDTECIPIEQTESTNFDWQEEQPAQNTSELDICEEAWEIKNRMICAKAVSCEVVDSTSCEYHVKSDKKRKWQDSKSEGSAKKHEHDLLSFGDGEDVVSTSEAHFEIVSSHDCLEDSTKRQTKSSENGSELGQSIQVEKNAKEQNSSGHMSDKNEKSVEGQVSDDVSMNSASKSKKRRKRKKKSKTEEEKVHLRVISKAEWKTYRNRYLSLQRATMARIKKILYLDHQPTTFEDASNMSEEEDLCFHDEVESPIQKSALDQKHGIEYQPGVIIKITLTEPISTCSNFKKQIRTLADVRYVDAVEGESDAFVRCSNPENAASIMKEENFKHLGASKILQGEEETAYWKKLQADRSVKFSNNTRQKKRGRDKIISKAEKLFAKKNTHVRFNE